jgi:ribose 5-phosphate isomerase B
MSKNPVAIASDHAGFEQKQQLTVWLRELGFPVLDLGPSDDKQVDYPDYAYPVAKSVTSGNAAVGILICGTGIGMAIAANKSRGIRAANITDPRFAVLAREHNNANIVTLSARFVDVETNKQIVENFLSTEPAAGRHASRVAKIQQMEESFAAYFHNGGYNIGYEKGEAAGFDQGYGAGLGAGFSQGRNS